MRCWVIDTNVVVSGLLSAEGPCAGVIDAVMEGRVRLVHDARILAEYRDVLCRPRLKLSPASVMRFLDALGSQMQVTPEKLKVEGPAPDDVKFIEAALAVPDRTIVTGNLSDFPEHILCGTRMLTPVKALAELAR
jgi:putative PIN family toxin of toxin-antitoxin system